MNKKLKISLVLVFCVFGISLSMGQHNTNSPYSRYGIGDLEGKGFGMNRAMGGIQAGLRSGLNINSGNPASYTSFSLQHFIFEVGLTDKITQFTSGNSQESHHSVNINYLACGFSITNWWKTSFGIMPFSSVGYDIQHSSTSTSYNFGKRETYNYFKGSGGINQIYLGHAFRPFKNFSVGANVSYLFGTVENDLISSTTWYLSNRDLTPESALIDGSTVTNSRRAQVKDIMLNYGVQYTFTFHKIDFTLGATFDNKKDLSTTFYNSIANSLTVSGNNVTSFYKNDTTKSSITLPKNLGLGLTINTGKFLFGADYYQQDWTNAGYLGAASTNYTKSDRLSIGLQYIPSLVTTNYWKAVSYRIGGHLTNTNLQVQPQDALVAIQKIKDIGVSFGAQLAIPRSAAIVNLSVEMGKRGVNKYGLIEEKYAIVHLNFNLHEFWFIKAKFD